MLVVMGDWSAKIGQTNIKSKIVGKFGLGERNERGDRLEDFCQANDFFISNTMFQQHPRRLWTWKSPGDNARNQIDYILMKRRWRSSLFSARTRPGADCGSDHQLLVAHMRLKLKANKREVPPVRYDVDNVPEQYTVCVENKFHTLLREADEEQSPNELWEGMKEAVLSAAEETIPKKRRKKQPWISQRSLELADERQEARKRGDHKAWLHQHKEVTKSIRKDQRDFVERKCSEMEKAGGDSKKIYGLVKELTQKSSVRSDVIKDRNGITLTESSDIKTRWAEYCFELYEQKNQEAPTISRPNQYEAEPPPLESEIRQAIKQLKMENHQAVTTFQENYGKHLERRECKLC